MAIRKLIITNKDEFYRRVLFLSNVLLVLGATLAVLYLLVPLFGGKFSAHAVIAYASWAGIGVGLKPMLRRRLKGLRVRAYDYIVACLSVIFSMVIWERYPINVILIILTILAFFFSYRAQNKT